MAKGMNITTREFDRDDMSGKPNTTNMHASEHKPHVSAENSTKPHKPKKRPLGNLGAYGGEV